jgi:hypothetical protein
MTGTWLVENTATIDFNIMLIENITTIDAATYKTDVINQETINFSSVDAGNVRYK